MNLRYIIDAVWAKLHARKINKCSKPFLWVAVVPGQWSRPSTRIPSTWNSWILLCSMALPDGTLQTRVMTQTISLSCCHCSTQETLWCKKKVPLSIVPLTPWSHKNKQGDAKQIEYYTRRRGWGQEVQYFIMDAILGECSCQWFS